jgi:CheY-like chemotaxis protein
MTAEAVAALSDLDRIVLVDDNDFDNEYATIMLRRAGFTGEVPAYTTGEQALAAFREGGFERSLLLLDINMPGMNGFEFARALADLSVGSPPVVVMLTSSPDPQEVQRAGTIEVIRGFTIKPLSVDTVREIALTLLRPAIEGGPTSDSARNLVVFGPSRFGA